MDTGTGPFATVAEFLGWCRQAPRGTRLDAAEVADILARVAQESREAPERPGNQPDGSEAWTWRERLWTVPSETRLGVAELAEALGRPKSYVYARTGPSAETPLPHRKLDGTVIFTAGEVRAWIREQEVEVLGGPMDPPSRPLRVA